MSGYRQYIAVAVSLLLFTSGERLRMVMIMDNLNLPSVLEQYGFWNKLQALQFVEAIYLFGSRARGDTREKSDIDVAIECPLASQQQWQLVLDMFDQADTLLMVDVVRYDTLKDSLFKRNIDKDKWVVYEK